MGFFPNNPKSEKDSQSSMPLKPFYSNSSPSSGILPQNIFLNHTNYIFQKVFFQFSLNVKLKRNHLNTNALNVNLKDSSLFWINLKKPTLMGTQNEIIALGSNVQK